MIKYFKFDPIPEGINQSSRGGNKIEWLVIHDTANFNKGAGAYSHKRFFSSPRRSSAHVFIDDTVALQIIGDSKSAWHCGDNQGKGRYLNGCRNNNSMGFELCVNPDSNYEEAYKSLVELIKNYMYYLNIKPERVCRHYDVSRKRCPGTFFDKGLWNKFQQDIRKEREYDIDIRKPYAVPIKIKKEKEKEVTTMEKQNVSSWAKEAWVWAVKNKITDGERPKAPATREEVIAFIYRLYEVMKNERN